MPLVEKIEKENMLLVSFKIPESLKAEVKNYCKWAEVKDGHFYVTAIEFILKKDRGWQQHKKQIKGFK